MLKHPESHRLCEGFVQPNKRETDMENTYVSKNDERDSSQKKSICKD